MKTSRFQPSMVFPATTPECAYFLGFAWADASVHHIPGRSTRITLEILASDAIEIAPLMGLVAPWLVGGRHRAGRQPQALFIGWGREFARAFVDAGFCDRLPGPARVLAQIRPDLHPLFWRGFFDGDGNAFGSKTSRCLTWAGPFAQDWSVLASLCESIGAPGRVQRCVTGPKSAYSAFRITKLSSIAAVRDYLFSDHPDIGLPRKRAAFDALIGTFKRSIEWSQGRECVHGHALPAGARTRCKPCERLADVARIERQGRTPCATDGCVEPLRRRGLCSRHYDADLRARRGLASRARVFDMEPR